MIESIRSSGCDTEEVLEKIREAFSASVRLLTERPVKLESPVLTSDNLNISSDVLLPETPDSSSWHLLRGMCKDLIIFMVFYDDNH